MQAGLATKRLSFREVFVAVPERILFVIIFIYVKVDLGRSQRAENGSVTTVDDGRTNFFTTRDNSLEWFEKAIEERDVTIVV